MLDVRIKNGFADRKGLNAIDKTIQVNDFSKYSRVAIKNKFVDLLKRWEKSYLLISSSDFREYVVELLANEVFCVSLVSEDASYIRLTNALFECIGNDSYFNILSVIELLANRINIYEVGIDEFGRYKNLKVNLENEFNQLFEDECIGYRFVGGRIEQIVDQQEIDEINKALLTPFDIKVNSHIEKALDSLSPTGKKDYPNSIKESVLALEGLCALITKKNGTLSDHIKLIKDRYNLHPCMEQMINKLYGYANDEGGIRHENEKLGHKLSFEEAKYILVLCCSTINYLMCVCGIEK